MSKRDMLLGRLHSSIGPADPRHAISYRVVPGSPLTVKAAKEAGDNCSSQITVCAKQPPYTLGDVTRIIADRNTRISARDAQTIILDAFEVIAGLLQDGYRVQLDKYATFSVSLCGRADPDRPLDVRDTGVTPHCTLRAAFRKLVNDGARLIPEGDSQPTTVEVTKTLAYPAVIYINGNFHGADRIRAEVELGDGRRVACDVDYSRPEGSKRPIGYSLTVTPDCPLPLGQAILTLRWIDGSGLARERKLIVNVTIEGDGEEVTD